MRALRVVAVVVALVGCALRIDGFGRYGLWNDEAWVATATRVHGVDQFLLALSVTPVGWGALLLPLARIPGPPEIVLRLLPLAFGLAALALAWRLGTRLAGHELGGLAALALVALDPTGIAWAKQLKPYTAEAACMLVAFLAAAAVARAAGARAVLVFALVMVVGATLSNAQMLLAPPLLVALGLHCVLRRDRPGLRRLVAAALVIGLWDAAWYRAITAPRVTLALREFWEGHYAPRGDAVGLVRFARDAFGVLLAPGLGAWGVALAGGGLGVLLASARSRWAVGAVVALVAELLTLSLMGTFPLDVPRVMLFVTTLLLVTTGAAVGAVGGALWARPRLRPVAAAVVAAVVVLVAPTHRSFTSMDERPEDLGPLLARLERERGPDDRILLYERSLFVWGYYQPATPTLLPSPDPANGWVVAVDDPRVTVVGGNDDVEAAVARAFAGGGHVWLVASRLRAADEVRIAAAFSRRCRSALQERRERALLVLCDPTPASPGTTPPPGSGQPLRRARR